MNRPPTMEEPAAWNHAVVEVVATDAWIPVDDAASIAEFVADAAYAVHHVRNAGALVDLLQRPHAGTVRAARELLGMLSSDLFREFMGQLTGKTPVKARAAPRPSRRGRS